MRGAPGTQWQVGKTSTDSRFQMMEDYLLLLFPRYYRRQVKDESPPVESLATPG